MWKTQILAFSLVSKNLYRFPCPLVYFWLECPTLSLHLGISLRSQQRNWFSVMSTKMLGGRNVEDTSIYRRSSLLGIRQARFSWITSLLVAEVQGLIWNDYLERSDRLKLPIAHAISDIHMCQLGSLVIACSTNEPKMPEKHKKYKC